MAVKNQHKLWYFLDNFPLGINQFLSFGRTNFMETILEREKPFPNLPALEIFFFFWSNCPSFRSSTVTANTHKSKREWSVTLSSADSDLQKAETISHGSFALQGELYRRCLKSTVIHQATILQRWFLPRACQATEEGVKWLQKRVKILLPSTDLSCSGTALESVALMCQTTSYTRRHAPPHWALSLISWIKATNTWTESSLYSLLQSQPAKRWSADQRATHPRCARRVMLPTNLTRQ